MLVLCVFLVIGAVQCARIRRQAVTEAPVAATTAKTDGMNVALGFMVDELDKESALGGPVNPAGLKKATVLALKIQLLGGKVDEPTQDKLASLLADAADPSFSQYAGGASKPADTKVNLSQFGA
ncbi:hypothetical protein HNY73_006988 [Argiope bruennichi]|uniref:Uncharacterized protein n=1 Tax=Argiope bruennichi TaxID=94029 RepID=A0A8T0FD05_ARGBR|nr:hypothetical protein HNY73_006988 [Argiope bruennichi]